MEEMETELKPEQIYRPDVVVWTKLTGGSGMWWPAKVQNKDTLDPEVTAGLRIPPLVVVKFLNEDAYDHVRSYDHIYLYNCKRKEEFLKIGFKKFYRLGNEKNVAMFPLDVQEAERLTGGDPDIIHDPRYLPREALERTKSENGGRKSLPANFKSKKTVSSRKSAPGPSRDDESDASTSGTPEIKRPPIVKQGPSWDPYPKYISVDFSDYRKPPSDDPAAEKVEWHICKMPNCDFRSTNAELKILHYTYRQCKALSASGKFLWKNPVSITKKQVVKKTSSRAKKDSPKSAEKRSAKKKKLPPVPVGEFTPPKKSKESLPETPNSLEVSQECAKIIEEWTDDEEEKPSDETSQDQIEDSAANDSVLESEATGKGEEQPDLDGTPQKANKPSDPQKSSSCFDFDDEEPAQPDLQSSGKFGQIRLPRVITPEKSKPPDPLGDGNDIDSLLNEVSVPELPSLPPSKQDSLFSRGDRTYGSSPYKDNKKSSAASPAKSGSNEADADTENSQKEQKHFLAEGPLQSKKRKSFGLTEGAEDGSAGNKRIKGGMSPRNPSHEVIPKDIDGASSENAAEDAKRSLIDTLTHSPKPGEDENKTAEMACDEQSESLPPKTRESFKIELVDVELSTSNPTLEPSPVPKARRRSSRHSSPGGSQMLLKADNEGKSIEPHPESNVSNIGRDGLSSRGEAIRSPKGTQIKRSKSAASSEMSKVDDLEGQSTTKSLVTDEAVETSVINQAPSKVSEELKIAPTPSRKSTRNRKTKPPKADDVLQPQDTVESGSVSSQGLLKETELPRCEVGNDTVVQKVLVTETESPSSKEATEEDGAKESALTKSSSALSESSENVMREATADLVSQQTAELQKTEITATVKASSTPSRSSTRYKTAHLETDDVKNAAAEPKEASETTGGTPNQMQSTPKPSRGRKIKSQELTESGTPGRAPKTEAFPEEPATPRSTRSSKRVKSYTETPEPHAVSVDSTQESEEPSGPPSDEPVPSIHVTPGPIKKTPISSKGSEPQVVPTDGTQESTLPIEPPVDESSPSTADTADLIHKTPRSSRRTRKLEPEEPKIQRDDKTLESTVSKTQQGLELSKSPSKVEGPSKSSRRSQRNKSQEVPVSIPLPEDCLPKDPESLAVESTPSNKRSKRVSSQEVPVSIPLPKCDSPNSTSKTPLEIQKCSKDDTPRVRSSQDPTEVDDGLPSAVSTTQESPKLPGEILPEDGATSSLFVVPHESKSLTSNETQKVADVASESPEHSEPKKSPAKNSCVVVSEDSIADEKLLSSSLNPSEKVLEEKKAVLEFQNELMKPSKIDQKAPETKDGVIPEPVGKPSEVEAENSESLKLPDIFASRPHDCLEEMSSVSLPVDTTKDPNLTLTPTSTVSKPCEDALTSQFTRKEVTVVEEPASKIDQKEGHEIPETCKPGEQVAGEALAEVVDKQEDEATSKKTKSPSKGSVMSKSLPKSVTKSVSKEPVVSKSPPKSVAPKPDGKKAPSQAVQTKSSSRETRSREKYQKVDLKSSSQEKSTRESRSSSKRSSTASQSSPSGKQVSSVITEGRESEMCKVVKDAGSDSPRKKKSKWDETPKVEEIVTNITGTEKRVESSAKTPEKSPPCLTKPLEINVFDSKSNVVVDTELPVSSSNKQMAHSPSKTFRQDEAASLLEELLGSSPKSSPSSSPKKTNAFSPLKVTQDSTIGIADLKFSLSPSKVLGIGSPGKTDVSAVNPPLTPSKSPAPTATVRMSRWDSLVPGKSVAVSPAKTPLSPGRKVNSEILFGLSKNCLKSSTTENKIQNAAPNLPGRLEPDSSNQSDDELSALQAEIMSYSAMDKAKALMAEDEKVDSDQKVGSQNSTLLQGATASQVLDKARDSKESPAKTSSSTCLVSQPTTPAKPAGLSEADLLASLDDAISIPLNEPVTAESIISLTSETISRNKPSNTPILLTVPSDSTPSAESAEKIVGTEKQAVGNGFTQFGSGADLLTMDLDINSIPVDFAPDESMLSYSGAPVTPTTIAPSTAAPVTVTESLSSIPSVTVASTSNTNVAGSGPVQTSAPSVPPVESIPLPPEPQPKVAARDESTKTENVTETDQSGTKKEDSKEDECLTREEKFQRILAKNPWMRPDYLENMTKNSKGKRVFEVGKITQIVIDLYDEDHPDFDYYMSLPLCKIGTCNFVESWAATGPSKTAGMPSSSNPSTTGTGTKPVTTKSMATPTTSNAPTRQLLNVNKSKSIVTVARSEKVGEGVFADPPKPIIVGTQSLTLPASAARQVASPIKATGTQVKQQLLQLIEKAQSGDPESMRQLKAITSNPDLMAKLSKQQKVVVSSRPADVKSIVPKPSFVRASPAAKIVSAVSGTPAVVVSQSKPVVATVSTPVTQQTPTMSIVSRSEPLKFKMDSKFKNFQISSNSPKYVVACDPVTGVPAVKQQIVIGRNTIGAGPSKSVSSTVQNVNVVRSAVPISTQAIVVSSGVNVPNKGQTVNVVSSANNFPSKGQTVNLVTASPSAVKVVPAVQRRIVQRKTVVPGSAVPTAASGVRLAQPIRVRKQVLPQGQTLVRSTKAETLTYVTIPNNLVLPSTSESFVVVNKPKPSVAPGSDTLAQALADTGILDSESENFEASSSDLFSPASVVIAGSLGADQLSTLSFDPAQSDSVNR